MLNEKKGSSKVDPAVADSTNLIHSVSELPDYADQEITLLKDLAKKHIQTGKHRSSFEFFEANGFYLIPRHFYEPIPDTNDLNNALWTSPSTLQGIDMNEAMQLRLLSDQFPQFADEYNTLPHSKTENPFQYYFDNSTFTGIDAVALYCMVRCFKPNLIIEAGSGFSTLLSSQAAQVNGNTDIWCIEPNPRHILRDGVPHVSQLIECRLQDVDIDLFKQLNAGDILFVDTTHVIKIGGEVNKVFFEILPSLQPGVIVHIHDIWLPNEYPKNWVINKRRFWTEQYLLRAFLMFNSVFEVMFAVSHLVQYHTGKLQVVFPNCPSIRGASFWMRKVS